MFLDQLPFIVTIMALAIDLLHLALPKDPFRGFFYYAVNPFFTNGSGSAFISFPFRTSLFWKKALRPR
jgi:hypothetical protein